MMNKHHRSRLGAYVDKVRCAYKSMRKANSEFLCYGNGFRVNGKRSHVGGPSPRPPGTASPPEALLGVPHLYGFTPRIPLPLKR